MGKNNKKTKSDKRLLKQIKEKQKQSGALLENFEDVEFLNCKITQEALKPEALRQLPRQVKDRIPVLHHLVIHSPAEAIPEIRNLIRKYPKVPMFGNYLANAYSATGNRAAMEDCIRRMFEMHPEYIFARINYAEICLKKGEPEKVPEIFDHKFGLKALYPERDVFHKTEAIGMTGIIGLYFCAVGQQEEAEKRLAVLMRLSSKHHLTLLLRKKLKEKYPAKTDNPAADAAS